MSLPPNLRALAAMLAAGSPAIESQRLESYLGDILEWNRRIPLVSRKSTSTVLERLVRESVGLWRCANPHLIGLKKDKLKLVDVGPGAGFPGIIWKLLEPALEVLLVERRSKKATFLERTVVRLGLSGIEVAGGDAAEISTVAPYRHAFAVATAMAVGPPEAVAPTLEGFLSESAFFCTLRPKNAVFEEKVGERLRLLASEASEFGTFCVYATGR